MHHAFYDTETTSPDPRYTQVLQAAAIYTDDDFMELDWLDERCRLASHIVPTAGALKVTHVDPYEIERAKYSSYEFACMLHQRFSTWGENRDLDWTGFNIIRFDEEAMRQMWWENLLDPYLSSGKGSYRNDLLTVVRVLFARNPECIDVPVTPATGKRNFKLENIAPLNGFDGHNAHDALGDVRATIYMARLIRDTDPALWAHMLEMGNARSATQFVDDAVVFRMLGGPMLDPGILDVCLIASDAANNKSKSAWNLAVDPTPYLDMTPGEILDQMRQRNTPFRTVKCNKQPAVFGMNWDFTQRVSNELFSPADPSTIDARSEMILSNNQFQANVAEALRLKTEGYDAPDTLEEKIYAGFPSWDDKRRMRSFHTAPDWSKRLEIVRSLEKPEMRQLGIRLIYLSEKSVLPEALRAACAAKIVEDRHCLDLDKPWATVGTLMKELGEMLEADPDDPELLNIRKWALETYPTAHDWAGPPPEPNTEEGLPVASETPLEAGSPEDPEAPKVSQASLERAPQAEAAAMSFLDGLD